MGYKTTDLTKIKGQNMNQLLTAIILSTVILLGSINNLSAGEILGGKDIVTQAAPAAPVDFNLDITDGLNGKLNLQPPPINLEYSQQYIALKMPIYVQLPVEPTAQQRVAEKILVADLKAHLKIELKSLEAGKTIDIGTIIKLAEANDPRAQSMLAEIYGGGIGVKQNLQLSL